MTSPMGDGSAAMTVPGPDGMPPMVVTMVATAPRTAVERLDGPGYDPVAMFEPDAARTVLAG